MTARIEPKDDLRQRTRDVFGCAIHAACCERGCKLGLTGIFNYVVIKGEDVAKNSRACDCIIIHGTDPPSVSLVELKSGNVKNTQVMEKFLSSADIIPRVVRDVFGSKKYKLGLLLLVKHRKRQSFYRFWRTQKFKIMGERYSMQILPCGSELASTYNNRQRRRGVKAA